MTVTYALIFAVGVAVAGWNTWQRLGRSSAARAWTGRVAAELTERSVLVFQPLIAVALMAGGLTPLARDDSALVLPIGGPMMLALVLLLAYLLLPLPIPTWVQPRWYREEGSSGQRRQARVRARAARRQGGAEQ